HYVIAPARDERVVAVAAAYDVIATAGVHGVVTGAGIDGVVVGETVDRVVEHGARERPLLDGVEVPGGAVAKDEMFDGGGAGHAGLVRELSGDAQLVARALIQHDQIGAVPA